MTLDNLFKILISDNMGGGFTVPSPCRVHPTAPSNFRPRATYWASVIGGCKHRPTREIWNNVTAAEEETEAMKIAIT